MSRTTMHHANDYFTEQHGVRFAGTHLLLDLWGCTLLDDASAIEQALRQGAQAAGATVLNANFHRFSPSGGVSGVLLLAESHISIHTWPEHGYAAIDIFMCGDCDPHQAVPAIEAAFAPARCELQAHRRGVHHQPYTTSHSA